MTKFDKVIPPGSEGKIYASVDTGHSEGAVEKFIDIKSNDPVHPLMKVSIKAVVKVLVKSNPDYVRFDVLKGHLESSTTTLIVDPSVKLMTPVSSSDMVKPEIITDKTGQKLRLSLTRTDVIGQHSVEIKVPAQGPVKEFTLPVVVYVRGPLEPNPTVISFQVNSFPEIVEPMTAAVLRNQPSSTSEVVTKLNPGRQLQVMGESNGWYQVITLQKAGSNAPGNDLGWIQNNQDLKAVKASEFPEPEKVQIKSTLGKPFVVLGLKSTLPTVKLQQKSGTQVDNTFEFTVTLQKVDAAKGTTQQGEIQIQTNNTDQPTVRIPLFVRYM